jgi:penicillin-binding protein 1A
MEMASAYGTFANGGRHARTTLIERVVDRDGRELFVHRPEAKPAVDPGVNEPLAGMLRDVVAKGTGTRARLEGHAPLGKTGTTQDSADAWFVGAVPSLSAAVWIGHPDARVAMPGSTGGEVAAPIWREFAAAALAAD